MTRVFQLLLLAACACAVPQTTSTSEVLPDAPAAAVEPCPAPPRRQHLALVVPRHTVDVKASTAGRLVELAVALGDRVEAGEVLARLDNADLGHALRLADASARTAAARLADARHVRGFSSDRARQAEQLRVHISGDELAQRRHELRRAGATTGVAEGELEVQRAQLERLRAQLDALALRAPFAAEVAAIYRDPGQVVLADEVVVRLVSAERIVRFAVDGGDVGRFPPGASIAFVDDAQRTVPGTVVAVAPEVDPANMILVEASLASDVSFPLPRSGSRGLVHAVEPP